MKKKFTGIVAIVMTSLMVLCLAMMNCILSTRQQRESLTMHAAVTAADTVSLFSRLALVFSVPLRDSLPVAIQMHPPAPQCYSTKLNAQRDTLYLFLSESMQGCTRYAVTPARVLVADNGSRLYPGEDSVYFVTYPAESGQNGSLQSADTLVRARCGVVELANDTDHYVIAGDVASRMNALLLRSFHSGCRAHVFRADTLTGILDTERRMQDTLNNIATSGSVHVKVFSSPPSAHQQYCVEILSDMPGPLCAAP